LNISRTQFSKYHIDGKSLDKGANAAIAIQYVFQNVGEPVFNR